MENILNFLNYSDFISEPFIAAHLGIKYELMTDKKGFKKNDRSIVLFGVHDIDVFLNSYDKIKLMALSPADRQFLKDRRIIFTSFKIRSPFLLFSKEFFELKGQRFKTLRRRINNYKNRNIEIFDSPLSSDDFEKFLREWKIQRQHAHFQIYISYDKNFYYNYAPKFLDSLITKFFYLDGELVGYSILEKVCDGCYNLLFHKALSCNVGFCLFMDFKMFEIIYQNGKNDFVVNMGSDSNEKGMYHYKTKSFPVEQRIFELYEVTINSNSSERSS